MVVGLLMKRMSQIPAAQIVSYFHKATLHAFEYLCFRRV